MGLELRAAIQLFDGHDVLVSRATAVAANMRPVRPKFLTSILREADCLDRGVAIKD